MTLYRLHTGESYPIEPVPKPRMTKGDRWQKNPRGARYRKFKQQVKLLRVKLPLPCKVTFYLPLRPSITENAVGDFGQDGSPHVEETPDADNLLKALMDALFVKDHAVWSIWPEKRWTEKPRGFFTVQHLEEVSE